MTSSQQKSTETLPARRFIEAGWKAILFISVITLASLACFITWMSPVSPTPQPVSGGTPTAPNQAASSLPEIPQTQINFRVQLPPNTPPGTIVFLTILDEVTGLVLNSSSFPMEEEAVSEQGLRTYSLRLTFKLGSIVQYRYERQAEGITVAEHVSDGSPVRYRLYHVEGPGTVEDVVGRWTDTVFETPTGRVIGRATDASTGQAIPNLLVTAGGQQTLTISDGSFLLEGLPPGIHNLVAFALDGSYRTFQQGAQVAADSTTPAELKLSAAPLVQVVFVVSLPADTPPIVPVRLAGNLYQLGNTFASLYGGISSLAANMPVLEQSPDGRHTLTLSLPAGADIRYKYTLGDGFWNAEHAQSGDFRLRQLVVPEQNALIEETVDTWRSGSQGAISFDVTVPASTPADDTIFIQFNPLFGWTEPIPMWSLGNNRWGYVLYSPLNLPGSLSYRYCRNGQCGWADDASTPGEYGPGNPVTIQEQPQTRKDQVTAWIGIGAGLEAAAIPDVNVTARGAGFLAGVEYAAAYRPSWKTRQPQALQAVQNMGANWLIISPTWTFTRQAPPVLEQIPGRDVLWFDLVDVAEQAQARNLNVAYYPNPGFQVDPDEWWQTSPRDFSWWLVWFEHYRSFILHHADLAAQSRAQALILGGDWLSPALPGGVLADGSPSGVPTDADTRWRELLAEVRGRYSGRILWALPFESLAQPPFFLDAVDQIYLLWSEPHSEQPGLSLADLEAEAANRLDGAVLPVQQQFGKPVVLAVNYSSDPDLQAQFDPYNALLSMIDQRDWISGFVTRGFYPPAVLQDNSTSVHGKPAGDLLSFWFPRMLANPAP